MPRKGAKKSSRDGQGISTIPPRSEKMSAESSLQQESTPFSFPVSPGSRVTAFSSQSRKTQMVLKRTKWRLQHISCTANSEKMGTDLLQSKCIWSPRSHGKVSIGKEVWRQSASLGLSAVDVSFETACRFPKVGNTSRSIYLLLRRLTMPLASRRL